jgi:hypothetical protein
MAIFKVAAIIGLFALSSCVYHDEVESVISDPGISSELPPEAAIQYLNNLLDQNEFDTGRKCKVFTTQSVTLGNGTAYNYTDSDMTVVFSFPVMFPQWQNVNIGKNFCSSNSKCCNITVGPDEKTIDLILTALHSLGITRLKTIR